MNGVTLGQLVPDPFYGMESTVKSEASRSAGVEQKNLLWSFVGSKAEEAVRDALDCDVFEVIAQGWCLACELHEYTDRTKHPIGEKSVVHLGEHAFKVDVHPTVVVIIDKAEAARLRFTLELAANFRAVALSICNGCITGIAAGDGYVSAQLKYGSVSLHKRKDSRKIKLPVQTDFRAPGYAIG
jgi:hypothetical protein